MSVNPYQELPLYGPEAIARYQGRELYERPPHLYAVANAAYGAMKRRSRDTCIVISGTHLGPAPSFVSNGRRLEAPGGVGTGCQCGAEAAHSACPFVRQERVVQGRPKPASTSCSTLRPSPTPARGPRWRGEAGQGWAAGEATGPQGRAICLEGSKVLTQDPSTEVRGGKAQSRGTCHLWGGSRGQGPHMAWAPLGTRDSSGEAGHPGRSRTSARCQGFSRKPEIRAVLLLTSSRGGASCAGTYSSCGRGGPGAGGQVLLSTRGQ